MPTQDNVGAQIWYTRHTSSLNVLIGAHNNYDQHHNVKMLQNQVTVQETN
jgi:hypothetical protein